MGMLDSIMQMFGSKQTPQNQKVGTQTNPNKGATTSTIALRNEYMQYQMAEQEAGRTALPFEDWVKAKQAALQSPQRQ